MAANDTDLPHCFGVGDYAKNTRKYVPINHEDFFLNFRTLTYFCHPSLKGIH